MIKRWICLLLALVLTLGVLPGNAGAQEVGTLSAYDVLTEVVTYLSGIDLIVGSTKGEWAVLTLARAELLEGTEEKALAYEQKVLTALSEGKLKRPTDYARVVLALTSLGKEAPAAAVARCQDFDSAQDQGINAVTYSLIALDTKPYAPDNTAIREEYLTYLLEHTCPGGGWVYGDVIDVEADVDMTAMVLQALAPYRERAEVNAAIEAALAVLAARQEESGAFATYGLVNAESTAQVIVALTSLGLDPTSWNEHDTIQALLGFYDRESSMFLHQLGGIPDQMATEQSAYALVAYARQQNGKSTLYDMKELFPSGGTVDAQEQVDRAARAIENLGHQTVPMTQVNTQEQAVAYIQERIAQLGITGPAWAAEGTQLTPATAGTEQAPEGTAGSFAVRVTVSMAGAADAVVTVSGTITPTAYTPPQGDAAAVDALIAKIGTVTYTPECGEAIAAARKAFDALSREEKEKVTGLSTLLAAEETYSTLETAAKAEKAVADAAKAIGDLGTQTVAMTTANTEAAVLSYVKTRIKLLNLSGPACDAKVTAFTAAKAGTAAAPDGTPGSFTVTVTIFVTGAASREQQVSGVITPTKYTAPKTDITVTVTLLGDSIHGESSQPHGLARGGLTTWISGASVTLPGGSTVLDALTQAFGQHGVSMTNPGGNYISALTYGGKTLGEFTNGKNSGWMYTLNGTHPLVGVAAQGLQNGDTIVFHYTDDYTYEEGGMNFGAPVVSTNTAAAVDALISQIGTVSYSEACRQKIAAAREAYNALSDAEKAKITKLSLLTQAETEYAALKVREDQAKAKAVTDLIAKLPTTITAAAEQQVKAARTAYDALTAEQKALVTNYTALTAAETALAKLLATDEDKKKAQLVSLQIDKLGNHPTEQEVEAARAAYEALTALQKQLVENLPLLEEAEDRIARIRTLGKIGNAYVQTGDYLEKLGTPAVGSVGGEWMVLGLARSQREVPGRESYLQSVQDYVRENIDAQQRLHHAKSTDNARLILALTALGEDVTNVDGHDLLQGLSDLEYVKKQGNNGPIWALLALDSGNYPASSGTATRQALIQEILRVQTADGGWTIAGDQADSDMTGMALQALAPYYQTGPAVTDAVDRGIVCLSRLQDGDGGFSTFSGNGKLATSESAAQVIVALTALGIDPDTDGRFVKNGRSVIDALLDYFVPGGGFRHISDGLLDGMATEQAYYALTAYNRLLEGKASLYDMTDVVDRGGAPEPDPTTPTQPDSTAAEAPRTQVAWVQLLLVLVLGVGIGAGGVLTAVLVIVLIRKKH